MEDGVEDGVEEGVEDGVEEGVEARRGGSAWRRVWRLGVAEA